MKKKGHTPVTKVKNPEPNINDPDWIIWAAWADRITFEEIEKKTVDCRKKKVPSEVTGIAFLSGGQSEIESSKNLNEINKINDTNFALTFSYGRALQADALSKWSGGSEDPASSSRSAFLHRAKMNSLARSGDWSHDLED